MSKLELSPVEHQARRDNGGTEEGTARKLKSMGKVKGEKEAQGHKKSSPTAQNLQLA